MIDPKNMWMAMAAFALVFAGWKALSPTPEPDKDAGEPYAIIMDGYGDLMKPEKITKAACVGTSDRIWLSHKDGNDCITIIVPASLKGSDKTADSAVIFVDGDVPLAEQNAATDANMRKTYVSMTDTLTDKFKVPFIVVARPGVLNSSGTHQFGGRRDDSNVVDAAIDDIKRKYGIKSIVMAGQSGGSRMIAQLLILGRRDITCAVLGSGAYDTPNVSTNVFGDPGRRYLVPMREVDKIQAQPNRKLYFVGDPKDTVTPFNEQQAFAAKLNALNHHAVMIQAEGKGEKHHGMSAISLNAAGLCSQGKSDAEIIAAAGKRAQP